MLTRTHLRSLILMLTLGWWLVAVIPAEAASSQTKLPPFDLSETELYYKMDAGGTHLTFQTCIAKDGNLLWGRWFVVAQPLKEPLRY